MPKVIAVIVLFMVASLSIAGCFINNTPSPTAAYEFKTGFTHPTEINDLMKHGAVVLYFTKNNCPPCDTMAPKIADLQSQYESTDVTFATLNYDDNATSHSIFTNYGIEYMPAILVIRGDNAVAKFTGEPTDINAVKSAIGEAQDWYQLTQYIDAYHQTMRELHPTNLTDFRVTRINSTTAQINSAYVFPLPAYYNTTSGTYIENATVIKFNSSTEAARYAITGYILDMTDLYGLNNSSFQSLYRFVTAYKLATGFTPSVHVTYSDGNGTRRTDYGYFGKWVEQNGDFLWLVEYRDIVS